MVLPVAMSLPVGKTGGSTHHRATLMSAPSGQTSSPHRALKPQLGNNHLLLPGFNGQWLDPLTGHYLLGNGYRAYNPVLMRFNRPDSLSPFGKGGSNAYAYGIGDPVNRADPDGHTPKFLKSILRRVGVMKPSPLDIKFRILAPEVLAYEDRYAINRTLIFQAHGNDRPLSVIAPSEVPGGGQVNVHFTYHPIISGATFVTPEDLYLIAKSGGINFKKYDRIHLLSCFSTAGSNPFNMQFARIIGKPVTGHPSNVYATALLDFIEERSQDIRHRSGNKYVYRGKLGILNPEGMIWL